MGHFKKARKNTITSPPIFYEQDRKRPIFPSFFWPILLDATHNYFSRIIYFFLCSFIFPVNLTSGFLHITDPPNLNLNREILTLVKKN